VLALATADQASDVVAAFKEKGLEALQPGVATTGLI
jgi:hypothetical protein